MSLFLRTFDSSIKKSQMLTLSQTYSPQPHGNFLTTKRTPLSAFQGLVKRVFVNVYDLLSVEKFRYISLNWVNLSLLTYFLVIMTYFHYSRQLK